MAPRGNQISDAFNSFMQTITIKIRLKAPVAKMLKATAKSWGYRTVQSFILNHKVLVVNPEGGSNLELRSLKELLNRE